MIRRSISALKSGLFFAEVIKSYADPGGGARVDLLLDSGAVIEGAELLLPRGLDRGVSYYPAAGDEVLAAAPPASDPIALGSFTSRLDAERVVESATLSAAGEYPEEETAISAAELRSGRARLICDQDQEAIFCSPRLRAQGSLEVSAGAAPEQSAAIAEPLLAYLAELQVSINAILEAAELANPEAMQAAIAGLAQVSDPPAIIASDLLKLER